MSDTISSGGFSSASAYCRSWLNAASRLARRPLYSQAKWWRFQTSAQPSPPASLRAPRSKQYVSPVGSTSAGVGSSSRRHRSMKCSWDAERSFSSDARHLLMNSFAVIGASSVPDDSPSPAMGCRPSRRALAPPAGGARGERRAAAAGIAGTAGVGLGRLVFMRRRGRGTRPGIRRGSPRGRVRRRPCRPRRRVARSAHDASVPADRG